MDSQDAVETTLCEACRGFDVRSLLNASKAQGPPMQGAHGRSKDVHAALPKFYAHLPNLTDLKRSGNSCILCSAIWEQYSKPLSPLELRPDALEDGLGSQPIYFGATQWDEGLHGSPTISVIQFGPRGESRTLAWFDAFAERDAIPPDCQDSLIGRSTTENSGSDACLKIAREMLDACLTAHEKCNRPKDVPQRMPTRVLQIDTEMRIAKLVNAAGPPKPFVALSYCWGGEDKLILSMNSEQHLRDSLPFDSFPKTMRDALLVTQSLGYLYLWIDAVCIFQDSPEDWEKESGRMRDVYKGAVVTIDAAASSKSTDGMFVHRPAAGPRCRLQWWNGESLASYIYLRPASEFSDTTLRSSATARRAWTLQENLLAPRTLHFGSQQIAFDCAEGRCDEAGRRTSATEEYSSKTALQEMYHETPSWRRRVRLARSFGLPTVLSIPYYWIRMPWKEFDFEDDIIEKEYYQLFFQGFSITPAGELLTYYDQWLEIVSRYTSRSMTNESDVLPALAGLAEEFHKITGEDIYVAGMWEGDFIRSMNWQRNPLQEKSENGSLLKARGPKQYIAPSWSWASVLGKRTMFSMQKQANYSLSSNIQVQDIKLETEGNQRFSRLLSGQLDIKGPVIDVRSPLLMESSDPRLPATHAYLKRLLETSVFRDEFLQQHDSHEKQAFSVLHLCSYRDQEDKFRHESYLLLETTPTATWRRVGTFITRRNGDAAKKYNKKRGLEVPPEDSVEVQVELKTAPWKKRFMRIV